MRACRFSSVRSGSRPANDGRERGGERLDHRLDRDLAEVDAERLGEPSRVAARALRRVARRHRDAVHALGAERLDAERRGQRRVDAARDADHDVAEAVLRHVVVQPELEREAHLLEVVELRSERRVGGLGLLARRRELDLGRARPARGRARARGGARRAGGGRPPRPGRRRRRAAPPRSRRRARAPRPRRRCTTEWPSKISSSCPPTALQSATKQELSRARTRSISSRSRSLPTWNGEAEMFATSCAPASARSVAGGPGCQMSSQIVGPTTTSPKPEQHEVAPRREVAVLVEDAVVRQVALAVDVAHLAVREHEARVVEVGVEVRRADERGDAVRRLGDLLDRAARRADEAGAEEQVLGRVAGDDELREEDEVGAGVAGPPEPLDDAVRVAVDVADDAIDLGECESHR